MKSPEDECDKHLFEEEVFYFKMWFLFLNKKSVEQQYSKKHHFITHWLFGFNLYDLAPGRYCVTTLSLLEWVASQLITSKVLSTHHQGKD